METRRDPGAALLITPRRQMERLTNISADDEYFLQRNYAGRRGCWTVRASIYTMDTTGGKIFAEFVQGTGSAVIAGIVANRCESDRG